jgi:hypothetical protein
MTVANFFYFDRPRVGQCAEAPTPGKDGQVAGGRVAPEAARPPR